MHVQHSWVLALLLVIPPVVALSLWFSFVRREHFLNAYGDRRMLNHGSMMPSLFIKWTRVITAVLGTALIILALSRPVLDGGQVEFPQGTADVIVMVDVSRSMAALDYKGAMPRGTVFDHGTRLDMARHLIREEVSPALGANRLGIVTYAGEAFPLAFLSNDASAVDWVQQNAATINSAPGEGSGLVKAFGLSFDMYDLDSDTGHRKIIILFSDGGNDDGMEQLTAVTQELHKRKIDLVVVGLGKTTPSPIPVSELSPQDRYRMRDQEFYSDGGEVSTSALDEGVLKLLAVRSGGKYVRVQHAADFSFSRLSERLEMTYKAGQKQIFFYPLLAGTLLVGLSWFLGERLQMPWQPQGNSREEKDIDHDEDN